MAMTEPFYHFGYRKIFPFTKFGDTSTFWIQKRYQVDQAFYRPREIGRYVLPPSDRAYDLEPALQQVSPWLLEQSPVILFPGRLQVTETYGYLPPAHEYPGVVTFDFPGIDDEAPFGVRDITAFEATPSGSVKLTLGDGFEINGGDYVIVTRPFGRLRFQWWDALTSQPARVIAVDGNVITLESIVFTTSDGAVVSTNPIAEMGVVAGYDTIYGTNRVRSFKRVRPPRTETVAAMFRREYVRYLPNSYRGDDRQPDGRRDASLVLPPLIPAFKVLDGAGEVTDTITATTSPTVSEWNAMIAERQPLVAETSRFGQQLGDIWYLETPYITITE